MDIIPLKYRHNKDGEYTPDNLIRRDRDGGHGSPAAASVVVAMLNNLYTDPTTGRFSTGVWSSTPGEWTFEQGNAEEFCYILEGKVQLVSAVAPVTTTATATATGARMHTFVKGDTFVIPRGFKGTWRTVETVKKFYATYDAPPAAVVCEQQAKL